MKLSKLLQALKIGAAVAKTMATGKTAKILEKVERGAEIAELAKGIALPEKKKK